ncbi:hypothetical protein [Chryseobacterium sp. MMS23-Vi53]|uniref:hypothetical protein n=1 Tax=Chryseobacterium sp. MMS23-Vi53 TaxID=3386644 RepID=UPI0039ECA651
MIDLIKQNKFEELKEILHHSKDLKIHTYFLQILNGDSIVAVDSETFDADKYQEEFLEGFEIYKALQTSTIDKEYLQKFLHMLVELTFKMSGFIQLMAENAMNKGLNLSHIEHIYKVDPILRDRIQELIEILKNDSDQKKAIANLAAAKARISNCIGHTIEKYQIGEDMLQFGSSYESVGETETAIRIYQGIMNDFESESVKLSSGLFPEISYTDERPESEIAIHNLAKEHFERLTGQKIEEPKRVHINESPAAKDLSENIQKEEAHYNNHEQKPVKESTKLNSTVQKSDSGFLGKIKKLFGKG